MSDKPASGGDQHGESELKAQLAAIAHCDPGCHGRCRACPADVIGDAVLELERLQKIERDYAVMYKELLQLRREAN